MSAAEILRPFRSRSKRRSFVVAVDDDRVELSNLNRQILYTEADIGLLKVEAAAARLRAFNSEMRVTSTARRLEKNEKFRILGQFRIPISPR